MISPVPNQTTPIDSQGVFTREWLRWFALIRDELNKASKDGSGTVSDLTELTDRVNTLEVDVTKLISDVNGLESDVGEHAQAIAEITARVDSIELDITSLKSNSHDKQHAINSTDNHSSLLTRDMVVITDENGLPSASLTSASELYDAILVSHDRKHDLKSTDDHNFDIAPSAIYKAGASGEPVASIATDNGSDLVVDGGITMLDPILNTQTLVALDRSLITKEHTGFIDPDNMKYAYDYVNRTVTVTNKLGGANKISGLYKGQFIAELETTSWTSVPRPVTGSGMYYLMYRNGSFEWTYNSPWNFYDFQIFNLFSSGGIAGLEIPFREGHGLMAWQDHEELHDKIGTYLKSGGALTGFTLGSNIAANRRPLMSEATIKDEDLKTIIDAITTNSYSVAYLSGNTGIINILPAQADVVPLSTNRPYYNQFTGGAWQQTLMDSNQYQKLRVWLLQAADDATSKTKRVLFFQGQSVSTNLATIQAQTTASHNLGELTGILPESIFSAEIIIRYIGTNWELTEVNALTGTRVSQSSIPAGNFLSTVSHDDTQTGDGTVGNPSVNVNVRTGIAQNTLTKTDDGGKLVASGLSDDGTTISTTENLSLTGSGSQLKLGNTNDGDAQGVICRRVVPDGQGAAYEKTELILANFNDNYVGSGTGTDQVTLRAPRLSFQTFNDISVINVEDDAGYNERFSIDENGNSDFYGDVSTSGIITAANISLTNKLRLQG